MRRARGIGLLLAVAACASAPAWLPWLRAEERTRIRLDLVDADGHRIERATVVFETSGGALLREVEHAGGRWLPPDPPEDPGWGRRVARARIRAVGCARTVPVRVERQTHGARFGRLAPHPVPLTHVYELRADARCPMPTPGGERGLPLARLVQDVQRSEPWSDAAVRELQRIGPAAAPALPALLASLETARSEGAAVLRVRAIGAMGAAGRQGAPALLHRLDDAGPALRRASARALERLGPDTPGVVSALGSAARRDPDAYVQQELLRVLGRMGTAAGAAEADLVAILESPDEEEAVRLSAFWALGRLERAGATEAQRRYAATHPILWSDPARRAATSAR